ncbi:hypothetical protein OSTOST_25465, partial [Ostertagia ostertagi]
MSAAASSTGNLTTGNVVESPVHQGTLFLGNMYDLNDVKKPIAFVLQEWTKTYGAVYGIQEGLRRTLVVSDVGMIRDLFMKQYDYFYGRK